MTQRDVPWWTLVKIVEGHVNKSYQRIIGMTPDEAWNLQMNKRWKILRRQTVLCDERDAKMYNKNMGHRLREGDLFWVFHQEKKLQHK